MPSGAQRFARQQIDIKTAPPAPAEFDQGTVTAVSGATPPVVTVDFRGALTAYPHLAAYSPTVGDVVAMCRYAGSWLIVGKPVGFP